MDPGSAIKAPIVGLKVGTDGEALLAELALPSGQGRCGVRLKLTFLHILAGRLAIDQAYSEDLGLHRHLLFRQYWTTYSNAVEFNDIEETDERLPQYRDAVLPVGEESAVEVGRVFSQQCGFAALNLTALGANAFTSRFGRAASLLASFDVQDEE